MELWEVALSTLVLAAAGLLVAAIRFASVWIGAKTEAIRNEELRRQAHEIRGEVEAALTGAVKEVAQVYVDERKAARADGKLTYEEKSEARDLAWNTFKERLTEDFLKTAEEAIPNLATWAMHEIESILFDQKLLAKAAAAASPKSP